MVCVCMSPQVSLGMLPSTLLIRCHVDCFTAAHAKLLVTSSTATIAQPSSCDCSPRDDSDGTCVVSKARHACRAPDRGGAGPRARRRLAYPQEADPDAPENPDFRPLGLSKLAPRLPETSPLYQTLDRAASGHSNRADSDDPRNSRDDCNDGAVSDRGLSHRASRSREHSPTMSRSPSARLNPNSLYLAVSCWGESPPSLAGP